MPVSERKKVRKIFFGRNKNFELSHSRLLLRNPSKHPHVYHPDNLPVSVLFINAL